MQLNIAILSWVVRSDFTYKVTLEPRLEWAEEYAMGISEGKFSQKKQVEKK